MARQRIFEDHAMTGMEAKRLHDDRAASIDKELDEAFAGIDWNRRREAEKSLAAWTKTYCVPLLLQDEPSPKGYEVLSKMERALTAHQNYMICMPRGQGKTSFTEVATLYALATGIQKYVVCISNNARAAAGIMQDIWRAIAETGTAFAQDYPGVCCPFHLCNGSFRRRQTYRGVLTEIQKNQSNVVLARLFGDDGKELPTSGSVLTCRGVSGGLRGMKFGKMRPTLVLLDDLQSTEQAENPMQVQKLLDTIKKDIMPLGGKERLSILQTATPIAPDDLVQTLQKDKNWITSVYKALARFPSRMDLWKEYFGLYDQESAMEKPHAGSLAFYRKNQAEMDEGAETFNDQRYSQKDGHISAVQKLLEIQHVIGDAAFQSEYQMQPKSYSFAVEITPRAVSVAVNGKRELEVPEGFVFVAASTDLNTSYAATTAVTAFRPDMTAAVLYHSVTPCNVDQKLNDTAYAQEVFKLLVGVQNEILGLGVKIDGWAIDCGGRQWEAVTQFAKQQRRLPACAFAGRSSHVFNPFVRSRLRDAINRTVLCGDAAEHGKAGAGQKYVFFDADYWKVAAQKALTAPPMSPGSCSLYSGQDGEHTEFALQVCNEKLKFIKHRPNGRDEYFWKTLEPHDYLDCMSMCYAVAASQGITGASAVRLGAGRRNAARFRKRPRVRVV